MNENTFKFFERPNVAYRIYFVKAWVRLGTIIEGKIFSIERTTENICAMTI